jgi:Pyridoxamine 5'-phosphate oxidase like
MSMKSECAGYYRDSNREWVSVSGTAMVSRDRTKIHELYAPDWHAWAVSAAACVAGLAAGWAANRTRSAR